MKSAGVLLAAFALVSVLAGCVGTRPAATPNPDPVCEAAESLAASLTALRRADPSTPVGDVKVAAAGAAAAYQALKEELGNFSEERVDALSAAMRDLETAARQLPEDITVEGAFELMSEEFEAVAIAWRALGSEIGCPQINNPNAESAS